MTSFNNLLILIVDKNGVVIILSFRLMAHVNNTYFPQIETEF